MRPAAILASVAMVSLAACSKHDAPPPASAAPPPPSAPATTAATSGCPATGQWAECSVLYRLDRAGLAPHVDSGARPAEKELTGRPLVLKIGLNAQLELYLYPDSMARIADAKKLDRTQLVSDSAEQTIKRERTLIETSNIIGLLTSINAHQRERVGDALLAGAPQAEPQKKP